MERYKDKLLTVGELARKCGVTVRTLQYYDEKGLLIPSGYSNGGRRMYSRHDILRLQQIVFLKTMGFSLEEIRDRMLPAESASELEQVFIRQKEIFLEQIAHIQETVNYMDKIIDVIRHGGEVDIDKILIIVGAIQKGNPFSFLFRYISKDQREHFFNCIEDEEVRLKLIRNLKALSSEVIELSNQNERPDGIKGQELAGRWWNLMMSITKGDSSFLQDLVQTIKSQINWPSDVMELNEGTMLFFREAVINYLRNNNINLLKENYDV